MTNRASARFALLVAIVVVLALVPAAFAGKGGGRGGSGGGSSAGSLSLVMVDDANVNGAPNYAETVTFNVVSDASNPYVNVRCYQGTAFVYDSWAGFYPGAWFGQTFLLSSTSWLGGAADCTARLVTWSKNGREQTVATMAFNVAA